MSGVKGRSGRRSKSEEERRRDILQRAWDLTKDYFDNPEIHLIEKQKVATQLVIKDITQKQSIEGDALTKIIIAYSNNPNSGRVNLESPELIGNNG
jgi:hypothetical protein